VKFLKRIDFNMKFANVEYFNPLFSKCMIYVASPNLNRNNSFISKEAFDDAIKSMYGVPIIGEYIEDRDNFGGHGGKLEITDSEIKFVSTTKAYGHVPESAEIYWDEVEENGQMVEYLVVKDALLWTSRYPEILQLIDTEFGQSMEIEILEDGWKEVDGKKVFDIKKFLFSALCILGVSKSDDPYGHVEPCFPSASITAYTLDKEQFKEEFKQMMAELKFSLHKGDFKINQQSQKGGKNMEELQKLLEKYSLTLEDLTSKEINHEEYSLEDLETKIQEVFKEEEPVVEFALTAEQLEDELKRGLCMMETIQEEWWDEVYSYPRYSYVDAMPDQMVVVAYDCKDCVLVGFNYAMENEKVEIDTASAVRYKVNFVPMDLGGEGMDAFSRNFTSLSVVDHKIKVKEGELTKQFQTEKESAQETLDKAYADFAKLQEDYSKLEESAKELEQFKLQTIQSEREQAETELFERFSTGFGLTEEDMASIKEKKSQFSIEELEEKLFALAGRKKLSFSKVPETKPIRFQLPNDNKPSSDKEWADLVEQHKNK
jgi:hypothetical protein